MRIQKLKQKLVENLAASANAMQLARLAYKSLEPHLGSDKTMTFEQRQLLNCLKELGLVELAEEERVILMNEEERKMATEGWKQPFPGMWVKVGVDSSETPVDFSQFEEMARASKNNDQPPSALDALPSGVFR